MIDNTPTVEGAIKKSATQIEVLWTVRQVADYLQVVEQTVRGMAKRGTLPSIKIGRQWRFRTEDIDKYLKDSQAK